MFIEADTFNFHAKSRIIKNVLFEKPEVYIVH